jgi:hypothetical protein
MQRQEGVGGLTLALLTDPAAPRFPPVLGVGTKISVARASGCGSQHRSPKKTATEAMIPRHRCRTF